MTERVHPIKRIPYPTRAKLKSAIWWKAVEKFIDDEIARARKEACAEFLDELRKLTLGELLDATRSNHLS